MSPSRRAFLFKAITQLGFTPLVLNALYRLGLWSGHYRRVTKFAPRKLSLQPAFLFDLPSRELLLETLGADGKTTLVNEAEEIIHGKFRMFCGEPVDIKLTGDWTLAHWTDFETGKIKLDGDIKFIWEPARFGWAFTLGRAYRITRDEKYPDAFWKYFETFNTGNSPYLGPHWMNGQEVAIRMMALVWAAQVFETASASSAERRAQLIQSIHAHAQRIPPTLVYARSQNNNHLVTEAAALYTAGLFLDRPRWRALGWRWLNESFQNQISGYGEYIQHSTNYHRLMLQAALWIHAIKKDKWPYATTRALTNAAHWLFSMLDPVSGRTPNLGANDGALILPLSSTSFEDFRPTVQAAARAFLRTGLPAGLWDETSLWLGLPASEKTSDSDAYLTDHVRGRNSWAYLRASRFKSRLSHMDQLHIDLWWRGLNVAQDAGTYLYNADPPWDNPLVSTRVHNTVTVDGHDQMTRGGRFLTLDWFPAYSKSLIELDENISGRVMAYHKGYAGVRHERTVTVYRDERWTVEDKLASWSPHDYRLHWLLMDGEWKMEKRGAGVGIRIRSPLGWIDLNIKPDPPIANSDYRVSLVRAGELVYGRREVKPYEGWSSPAYGQKVPGLSFVVEVASVDSITFTSQFIFPR